MRQALSWFLSILFHALLVGGLLHTVDLKPILPEELMEVDLTQIQQDEIIAPMPLPVPAATPIPQPEPPAPEDMLPGGPPLPMDQTITLDDSPPPPPAPEPAPAAEPEPEPGVIEISPNKTLPPKEPPKEELAEDGLPKKIYVRDDGTAHRGAEARFGRMLMGDYFSYSEQEFSGQFKTKDDLTISIIDARNTKYGRFLIYDSKNKTLRRLKQALGKYVYTIGPSVFADEPVTGTVTFLAKNDRIERFILVTDDDRIAHYPRKVHVREEEVAFQGPTGEIRANLSRPPYDEGHAGAVILHGAACTDPGLVQGFTRTLSMQELATLAFPPRGCDQDPPTAACEAELVADGLAAYRFLADHPQIDHAKAGIWGNGPGAVAAIEAATQAEPAFLVCLLGDGQDVAAIPQREVLARLTMPVLWVITGRDVARWDRLIKELEGLRDRNKLAFTIIRAPLKASHDVEDAQGEQSGWVEQVTDNHAAVAVSWIKNLR